MLQDKADEDNCMIQTWSSMVEGHFKSIDQPSADLINIGSEDLKIFQEYWTLGTRDSFEEEVPLFGLLPRPNTKGKGAHLRDHWPPQKLLPERRSIVWVRVTIQYNTIQYDIVQCFIIQYNSIKYIVIQFIKVKDITIH